jgi:hypothetical protein
MNRQCGQYFDDRQDARPEDNLLNQIASFYDRVCGAGNTVSKKKPWNHAGGKPEDEREIIDGRRFETNLKDKPKYQNRYRWIEKCPNNSQVGTQVFRLEILPSQFKNDPPVPKNVCHKQVKLNEEVTNPLGNNHRCAHLYLGFRPSLFSYRIEAYYAKWEQKRAGGTILSFVQE